ncbi:glycosyltransferase [Lacinutrix salivirga]
MTTKTVLIITYYWPPAGGPGVQRWLKFVKYLPEFTINPIVYCPENPSYPIIDESLVNDINSDVVVIKQPISEPYKLALLLSKKSKVISKGIISDKKKQSFVERLMLYIRGNYFIPDARKSWVKPSVKYLQEYIKVHNIDTVITTGPPHSLHLIGLELKKRLNVTWLADFRDPWTTIGYHKKLKLTKSSQRKHKQLEAEVLQTANHIIVTSENTKTQFKSLTQQPITVITNGFDEENFNQVELDSKFSISHIGSLLSERNPEILWTVLGELIEEVEGFEEKLQLNFIGIVSKDVLDSAEKFISKTCLSNIGYVPHNEAVEFQKKSQLLVLIEIDSEDTKVIIPGKLFEYLNAKRPLIALGPKGSDVERIINDTNSGAYFNYNEKANLKSHILQQYNLFLKKALVSNAKGIEKYSRFNLTKTLAELL